MELHLPCFCFTKSTLNMKKYFIITTLACLIGAVKVNAQVADTSKANSPEISFATTEHDYQTIEVGGNGTYKFVFTNTGKTPLILTNVVSSCGCTTPIWPKVPIKPGEKSEIEVGYNTNNVGPFSKSITVFSNGKTSPLVLRIKGVVKSK